MSGMTSSQIVSAQAVKDLSLSLTAGLHPHAVHPHHTHPHLNPHHLHHHQSSHLHSHSATTSGNHPQHPHHLHNHLPSSVAAGAAASVNSLVHPLRSDMSGSTTTHLAPPHPHHQQAANSVSTINTSNNSIHNNSPVSAANVSSLSAINSLNSSPTTSHLTQHAAALSSAYLQQQHHLHHRHHQQLAAAAAAVAAASTSNSPASVGPAALPLYPGVRKSLPTSTAVKTITKMRVYHLMSLSVTVCVCSY